MLQSMPKVGDVIYTHPDIKSNFKQSLVRELTVLRVGRKYIYSHEADKVFKDEYRYNIDEGNIQEYWGKGDWVLFSPCVSTNVSDLEIEVNLKYLKRKLTIGLSTEEINTLPKHILDVLAEYF